MRKIKRSILSLCFFYIIYVFMYGIVIKFTMSNSTLFTLKTYIPEVILALVCALSILCNGGKAQIDSLLLISWSLVVFVFNVLSYGTGETMLYLVRDIYVPLVTFCILKGVAFDEIDIKDFQRKLVLFSKVYLLSGLVLCIIEQMMGWEWTSTFYTGYSFYGQDPVSKVKIAHNLGLLRAPSWTGNFATFGFYCLIAYALVTCFAERKRQTVFWSLITAACLILCTNKSALVGFAIVLLFKCTVNFRKKSIRSNGVIIAIAVIIIGVSGIFLLGDNNTSETGFFTGFLNRFDVWSGIFDEVSWTELLFPYRQFMYGSSADGGVSFWDNTYFYALFSQGIIGTVLWIWTIWRTMRKQVQNVEFGCSREYLYTMVILLCALSMTVNITQGRGFLSEFLILLGIGTVSIKWGGYS